MAVMLKSGGASYKEDIEQLRRSLRCLGGESLRYPEIMWTSSSLHSSSSGRRQERRKKWTMRQKQRDLTTRVFERFIFDKRHEPITFVAIRAATLVTNDHRDIRT